MDWSPSNENVPRWCGHTNEGLHGLRHENNINIAQRPSKCKSYFCPGGGASR